jgi:hypothetical protein
MVGGAMQDEANRRQQSQPSEQYQRSENGAESRHTKKTGKTKNQKRKRDDTTIAKVKSPEPVANAPQAKPLNVDKFGE